VSQETARPGSDEGLPDARDLEGVRSVAFLVLDSLRWDSFVRATTPGLDRWAPRRAQRFAYASWTQPSHTCLLAGLLPYEPRPGSLAATTYAKDHSLWSRVLAGDEAARRHLFPEFCLPLMAQRCGWRTFGRVAMPVLNEKTAFSRGFDDYLLAPRGASFGAQIESLSGLLPPERAFVFMNLGDTHYPYATQPGRLPRLSGAHGVLQQYAEAHDSEAVVSVERLPFGSTELAELHQSQIRALELVDRRLERLLEMLPKPVFLLVVSDHGELFGEDGYFGHGPFFHRLLFEVPLVSGVVR
jgi:hypothetical protein